MLSVAGKVLAEILLKRLIKNVAEELMSETQFGFRKNRSTSDMMFAARPTLEKCSEQHRDLNICFVDIFKAFDKVERTKLSELFRVSEYPDKFIKMVRLLHDGMEARVKIVNLESEPFGVT